MFFKRVMIVFFGCLFTIHGVMAQTVLDSMSLSQQRVYKSLSVALQNPDSVYILDLSKKKLKQIPTEVAGFKNLQVLNLSRNNLKEVSGEIGSLANLQQLNLSYNKIKLLPPEIGNLSNLVYLGLNRNLIETLPAEMGKLKALEVLEMWDNELGLVPEELRGMNSLRIWELRGILFSEEEQNSIHQLLPDARIYFSPSCNCKY